MGWSHSGPLAAPRRRPVARLGGELSNRIRAAILPTALTGENAVLRILICIAFLVVAAAPAHAQGRNAPAKEVSPEDAQRQRDAEAADRQYRATLRATDQGKTPVAIDPWRNMRGPNEGKR